MEKKFVPWKRPAKSDKEWALVPRAPKGETGWVSARTGEPVGRPGFVSAKEVQRQKAAAALQASPAFDPKERARWKEALRQALRNLAYARQVESGETRKSGDFVVLNVEGVRTPQDDAERAVFFALIDELTVEDEAVRQRLRECVVQRLEGDLDDFDRGLAQRAGLADLRGQSTRHAPHEGLTGNPPPFAGFGRVAGPRSAYAGREIAGVGPRNPPHPDWYLGFWKDDSYVTLAAEGAGGQGGGAGGPTISPGTEDAVGGVVIPASGPGGQQEQFAPDWSPGTGLPGQSQGGGLAPDYTARGWHPGQGGVSLHPFGVARIKFGSRQSGPAFTVPLRSSYAPAGRLALANYRLDTPPAGGGPGELWHQIGDGMLVVWDAQEWRGQVAHDHHYFDTDLFDRIELTVQAYEDLHLHVLTVVLNGVQVYQVDFGGVMVHAGRAYERHFENEIQSYRTRSVLYRRGEVFVPAPGYSPDQIIANPIVKMAAGDLGQGWSRKYDAVWERHHHHWKPEPRVWCSEFARWVIQKGRGLHGMPEEAIWTGDLRAYFASRDRWLCANTDAWESLGARITTGFWASVKEGDHSTIFLYWLMRNPEAARSHSSAESMRDDVREGPLKDGGGIPLPGPFDPTADINWFAVINGNQGGEVATQNFAIVRPGSRSWVSVIREGFSHVMIWLAGETGPYRPWEIFDGFGDTS
jgi:hypothetical protein